MFLYDTRPTQSRTTCLPFSPLWDNLSSFIRRFCHGYLNLALIIILENGTEPHFRTAYCLKYCQSTGFTKQFVGNFSGKHVANLSVFQSAHASEPYLSTVITVASNILILVFLLDLSSKLFSTEETTLSLSYSTFNMFTTSTVFSTITTKASEAFQLIDLFVTLRQLFIFTYSKS